MSTLLLRLAAPMQSWGADSKFEVRKTDNAPSKSGVIGLIAAALGRRRNDPLEDLSALHFGVRTDQPGELLKDFHTAKSDKTSYITTRYYLSDAIFLAGLESDDEEFLAKLEDALKHPVFPLFLGRRSCPPTLPLCLGIRNLPLLEALQTEPCQISKWRMEKNIGRKYAPKSTEMPISADCSPTDLGAVLKKDLPCSFDPFRRKYAFRAVNEEAGCVPVKPEQCGMSETSHDALAELE